MLLRVQTPDRLPKGLRRNGARLDAHATDAGLLFYDGHALAQLGSLNRSPLTRGTAADTNEVELVHGRNWRGFRE
jgi:hypothetical protein